MQAYFPDDILAKESTLQKVVFIPKEVSVKFRGIGLVKLLWKAITILLNLQLMTAIKFHDVLHGFLAGYGTGNSDLKAKLIQHFIDIREAVLFEVLLDLQKGYDALDRERCLEIIAAYRVGPRMIRILQKYRYWLIVVDRASR